MVSQRVFVGNLFQNYDICLEELRTRFGKFGKCSNDGFEKHTTFAYINMDFEQDSDFNKLKQSLNNVNFKGNTLKIDVARPDWQTRWKLKHEQDLKEEPLVKKFNDEQNWKHYKKLENIEMSWKDRKEVIPGRNRQEKRSRYQLRNSTFRVNVEGSLKVYKLYKNKLWGYERDRTAQDLAYRYVNGKWWNNYNHIIDRLDYTRSRQSVHSHMVTHDASVEKNTSTAASTAAENKVSVESDIDLEDEMIEQEKSKTTNILDQFLGEMNFDKPLNVVDSDEAEAFGFSDNEGAGEQEEEQDQYNRNDYYNNNEEEDYYQQKNKNQHYNDHDKYQQETEGYEQEEEEYIPTFGAKPVDDSVQPVQGTVSNTETLRALFNPDTAEDSANIQSQPTESGSFRLIHEDNDDIDQSKNIKEDERMEVDDESNIASMENTLLSKTKNQNRLFFPHFDSPFLVGQTQLSQVQTTSKNDLWSNWEDQFWENRGVWMKEMKNKKRDVLRLRKKRQSKDNNIVMI